MKPHEFSQTSANKLMQKLTDKQLKLQEIFYIAREINNLSTNIRKTSDADTPQKFNSEESLKNAKYSMKMPKAASFNRRKSTRNTPEISRINLMKGGMELRKIALKNLMHEKVAILDTTPHEMSITKRVSMAESVIETLTTKYKKSAGIVSEINDLVATNKPVLTENYDNFDSTADFPYESSIASFTQNRSFSHSPVSKKLLESSENTRLDRIYKDFPKPDKTKKRCSSFYDELLLNTEYEVDPRFNTSCVLDSIYKPSTENNIILRRTNSMDIPKKLYEISENSQIINSAKKYFYWVFLKQKNFY